MTGLQNLYAGNPAFFWSVKVAAMLALFFVLITATAYVVWFERRMLGWLQLRPGPNRVGPFGLLQLAADGVKFVFKESFIPAGVDRITYLVAPLIGVTAAILAWAVIPVGVWYGISYWVADLNIGLLLIFALSAVNVYAIMLGGYASNNKYSLLGGLRAAAQLISYEVGLGLAVVPIFLIVGSLRLQAIAGYTVNWGPYHGPIPLLILAPVSFLIYTMSAVAETNRAPFDLPEAEQELTGGFLTEYSGLKFLLYYLAEYMNMVTQSVLISILFLGAWHLWFVPPPLALLLKVVLVLFLYVLLRATFPRLRYDQLMRLGWKLLLPVGLANVAVTAVLVVLLGGG